MDELILKIILACGDVDVDDSLVDVHAEVNVGPFYSYYDGVDERLDPENFRFLSHWIADIWYFISADLHVDVDDVLADGNVDVHVVHVDVDHDGYDGWVHPESFSFLS